jgi:hypothetical protein
MKKNDSGAAGQPTVSIQPHEIMFMTDPVPNPDLQVLLKWDGVGLPPKRSTEPEVHPIEKEGNEDDDAHENETPKSKKISTPAAPDNVGDSAS